MAPKDRSCNDVMCLANLIESISELAKLRDPGFDFEVACYAKCRRSQGPDRDGLAKYSSLLRCVLAEARRGLPGLIDLKTVWKVINEKYGVMASSSMCQDLWAYEAATNIRLMCRHLGDIKRSKSVWMAAGFEDLLSMIVEAPQSSVGSSSQLESPPSPVVAPIVDAPVRKLSRALSVQSSDASLPSVLTEAVNCQCSRCKVIPFYSLTDDDSCDMAAAMDTTNVPAGRGAVVRQLAAEGVDAEEAAALVLYKKPAILEKRASLKRPASAVDAAIAADGGVAHPVRFQVQCRRNPVEKQEAYIMQNGKFLVGCKQKQNKSFEVVIRDLAKEMQTGGVAWTKQAAVAALAERLA